MNRSPLAAAIIISSVLTACGGGSSDSVNNGTTPPPVGGGSDNNTIETPSTYTFANQFSGFDEGTSAVSYTGQTSRLQLIESLTQQVLSYTADQPSMQVAQIEAEMEFFFDGNDAISLQTIEFAPTGVSVLPASNGLNTFGSIGSVTNLVSKVAGNDTGVDAGALEDGLVNGEFFGWDETGVFTATGQAGERPEDLVRFFFTQVANEVVNGTSQAINVAEGTNTIDVAYVDNLGRDYRQLIQKFLLGAVTFSQGTSDYLQADFSADNQQDGTNPYSIGAHDWDESFGYFGAARNFNEFTDEEIAAKGGRPEFANGFNDANGDGSIDIRSEVNFGNAVNCAKRDLGTVGNPNPTDFTKTAFDAYLDGRTVLNNAERAASAAGQQVNLTAEQLAQVTAAGDIVAQTWERCIAATVIHYINDTVDSINAFDNGQYANLAAFKDLAKNWSEMKGFALGLQFNVESPIYASADNTADFKAMLANMGTGPILADASADDIAAYLADLQAARDLLQRFYSFDATNVAGW